MKKNDNSKNKLGLNLFEHNLKRHPSVKGLFDEDGNRKSSTESKDEVLLLNIENKNGKDSDNTINNKQENEIGEKEIDDIKEKDEINGEKEIMRTMSVKINRVEEKFVDNRISLYEEMNDENRKDMIKEKNKSLKIASKHRGSKPLVYGFGDLQKKFDEDITRAISKGTDYQEIEGKFVNQLKKKQ